jgi:hypothetical protein
MRRCASCRAVCGGGSRAPEWKAEDDAAGRDWGPVPGREPPYDVLLWIESHHAVAIGDTLIDRGQGVEILESWLADGVTREQVVEGLRPLLERPIEHVLPTHGPPADRAALERALS